MAEFLLVASFAEFIVASAAFVSLSAAILIQCGDKGATQKKSSKKAKKNVNAKKRSKKSVKENSAKSQRIKPSEGSKESAREQLKTASLASVKSNRSSREAKKSVRAVVSERLQQPKKPQSIKSASEIAVTPDKMAMMSVQDTQDAAFSQPEQLPTGLEKTTLSPKDSKYSFEENHNRVGPKESDYALQVKKDGPLELFMEPRELHFGSEGGFLNVNLYNPTVYRQAVKVKCSDNGMYRVNPVYGYIEPGGQLEVEVVRQRGNPKTDRLIFVAARAPADNLDMKKLFKSAPKPDDRVLVLPLTA